MALPTLQEMILIKELRSRITDIELDEVDGHDRGLVIWLRARNLNVNKAEHMLRKSMEFRKDFRFDTILSWTPPQYYDYYFPFQESGVDKDGLPVIICPACWWEPYARKEINEGRKDLIHRYIGQAAYRLITDLKLKYKLENKLITQFVLIFDMRGFCVKYCTSIGVQEVLVVAFRRFEANFPETLKVAYVVNAPKLFSVIFNIVKPILSQKTLEKVVIFDSDAEKWRKTILGNIDENQLPKYYGGTMKDTLHCLHGGAMHLFDKVHEENVCTIVIEAGGEFSLEYEIKTPGTLISWIFKTENYNIGFVVTRGENVLISYKKLDSHEIVQNGSVICLSEGKYVLTFDNGFSRFREKTLHYFVTTEGEKLH